MKEFNEIIKEKVATYEVEVIDKWIDEDEDKDLALERYNRLNSIMQPMYDLILSYSNYYSTKKDYGTGVELTMIEAHILQDLLSPDSQTVSHLADKWKRSKSAISQTLSKLEDKGLVEKVRSKIDRKYIIFELTELGHDTVIAHSRYDNVDIVKTHKKLFKEYTPEEMAIFFSICESYNDLLENN